MQLHRKVILYYPPVTPHSNMPTWEPLQLVSLFRVLRRYPIDVEIIDGRLFSEGDRNALILQKINSNVICFGITALTCFQLLDALNIAHCIKNQFPKLPIVFGGWHPTIFPEETLREDAVDIVVRGQGETTFLEVIERLITGIGLKDVKGVSWKKGNTYFHEEDRPLTPPDELPPILPHDFEILDLQNYQINNVFFYMSSVGCPYSCKYCCVGSLSRGKWLPLSARRVIQDIESLHNRFGFRELIFWDNVFFTNKTRVEEICKYLINRKLSLSWSAHGRINEIAEWDDAFMQLLKCSGCNSIFVGVESGSQQLLDKINKKIMAEDILPSFRKLKKYDINVAANWMVGLPGEKYEDVLKTIKCIKEGLDLYDHDLDKFKVHIYRFAPFPGTSLYNELKRKDVAMLPKSAREWGEYIYDKMKDGLEPWNGTQGTSLCASTTFYLWKAYLQKEPLSTFLGKIVRKLSRIRITTGFVRIPIEWWIWRYVHKKS
jgi:radical SAM superfamily enzyme YgiQ (UPF0313 family)